MILILGYRSRRKNTPPEIVYAGNSGSEARDAIREALGEPFVRMEKLVNPVGSKVPFRQLQRERQEARAATEGMADAGRSPGLPKVPASPPTPKAAAKKAAKKKSSTGNR